MAENATYLAPLLSDPSRLAREAGRRRKPFDEKAISAESVPAYEAEGWKVDRPLKRLVKVKREKIIDERLENRFWMLLFKMGYPEMNEGRKFTIAIDRKGAEPLTKQIDVFARDEETVIVAECKAAERVVKRSLQKDLEEFSNLKGPIANSIRKHYGSDFKPKVIWLFVTENIVWSRPDRERAAGLKIRIITERELRYYGQIAEHLRSAARYQFLAEFLKDQTIPELSGKAVPGIRGKLGGKKFYSFVTTPRDLLKIAFVNHRSLNDPEGAPSYQRLINRSRLYDIGSFIRSGGYFPNNILINFSRPVRFDKISQDEKTGIAFGHLYLPDKYRSAWVIDGQHRLYGFAPLKDVFLDQNIAVIAFEMLPRPEEANLFVTINHEQKTVPKHLLDDLEGELKWGSDIPSERIGAISARLINLLNSDVGEPFYNRITQQGIDSTNKTCLTIPALKDALRRSGLLGRAIVNKCQYDLGPLCAANDSETLDRSRSALSQYFSVIRNANLAQWESGREGHLCTNVAVQAYTMLLSSLIKYWEVNTATDSREVSVEDMMLEIEEYISPIREFLENADSKKMKETFQVPFGSGGLPQYYFRLCQVVKTKYPDFQPEGMAEWEKEQSQENIQRADRQLDELWVEIRRYIFDVFRSVHGEAKYWDKGVPDKGIRTKAYAQSLDDDDADESLPLETYLDEIDLKKIVEHKQNWPLFKSVFNIPEPGEKGFAKNLKWMERLNRLRRIPGHPAHNRHYKLEDFDYLDYIHGEFFNRLNSAPSNFVPLSSAEEIQEENLA
jgi:DGQHR domain-containing protein